MLWKKLDQNKFLEIFSQNQKIHTHYKLHCISHYIEVRPFILKIGNDFFLGPYFSSKSIILRTKACVVYFVTSNRSIMTFFGCQSFCEKLNQSKYIICPFTHGKIKIGSCKIDDILPMLEEHKAP